MKREGHTGHWCSVPMCGRSWQYVDDLPQAAIVAISGNTWGTIGENLYCPAHYAEIMQHPGAGK